MQMADSVHRSVLSCARSLYASEGLQAFYISYPTTLTMNIPLSAVQFSVYESVKSVINPSGEYSPSTHVIAGGLAGGVAAAVTTPLDVAKVSVEISCRHKDRSSVMSMAIEISFHLCSCSFDNVSLIQSDTPSNSRFINGSTDT